MRLALKPDTEMLEHLCENNRDLERLQRIWQIGSRLPRQRPGDSNESKTRDSHGASPRSLPLFRALAHHSFAAEFDENKPVKLTGTVTKLEWTNPHIWFFIDVKNPDGTVTNWGLEMASPNNLLRAGWKRDSMKVGDSVAVEARQARDGSSNANAQTVTLSSTGQRLFAGSPITCSVMQRSLVRCRGNVIEEPA